MSGMNAKDLENLDKQTLITLLLSAHTSLETMQKTVEQLNNNVTLLTEEVRILRNIRFGRKSEAGLVEMADQLHLSFNEAEVVLDLHPDVQEPEMEEIFPKPYKRGKKKQGKREEDLSGIPTRVEPHTLTEEELKLAFPDGKWKELPAEVYKRLEYHPGTFEVVEHHVSVYSGNGEHPIVRANRPADLLRNSIVTASLLAAIYNYKFVNSQPINRMAEEFKRQDVIIPTQNLCRWVIEGSERYLMRMYDRLSQRIQAAASMQ